MMERGEGGENHCSHTWGSVLTDGLRFRVLGSGQPAELPHSAGNPPEQLSSFPAGIQLSPPGPSRHRAAATEQQRKYNIASMKCCHPTPGSEPVILHVQSRQPVSVPQLRAPGLAKPGQLEHKVSALFLCTPGPPRMLRLIRFSHRFIWADLTQGCKDPELDLVL